MDSREALKTPVLGYLLELKRKYLAGTMLEPMATIPIIAAAVGSDRDAVEAALVELETARQVNRSATPGYWELVNARR